MIQFIQQICFANLDKKLKLLSCLLLNFVLVAQTQAIESTFYKGSFRISSENREAAVYQAVLEVSERAFAQLLGKERFHDSFMTCLTDWIPEKGGIRGYRRLVEDYYFSEDIPTEYGHKLEGKLTIDMQYVQHLWRTHLDAPICDMPVAERKIIYFDPVSGKNKEQKNMLSAVINELSEFLLNDNFKIVTKRESAKSQGKITLRSIERDANGKVRYLSVRGEYADTRIDGSPEVALNAQAEAALRTTPGELNNRLYRLAAKDLARQIREHSILASQQSTTINFRMQSTLSLTERESLLLYVSQLINLPNEFQQNLDVMQVSLLDDGSVQVSVKIPAKYRYKINRSDVYALGDIVQTLFKETVIEHEFSFDHSTVTLFSSIKPESWQLIFNEYMDVNALVYPLNASALSVVQRKLELAPRDRAALQALDQIVFRLVQRAISKSAQNSYASAYSDLKMAQLIGNDRPLKPWQSVFAELEKSAQKDKRPHQSNLKNHYQGSDPALHFPEIELASMTRGPGIELNRPIVGLAAASVGVHKVEVNAKEISTLSPADPDDLKHLLIEDKNPLRFVLNSEHFDNAAESNVTVFDKAGNSIEKKIKIQDGQFVVSGDKYNSEFENKLKTGKEVLQGTLHAVLFANQHYQRWNQLSTPIKDVEELQSALLTHYNIDRKNIQVKNDAGRDEIISTLYELHQRVKENDSVLVYYAGHGQLDMRTGKDGYWIPIDAQKLDQNRIKSGAQDEAAVRLSWISNALITDELRKLKAKHVLLISDSCYSGSFISNIPSMPPANTSSSYIYELVASKSRRAITSGEIEPVLDVGGEKHSIFAYHLINALVGNKAPFLTAQQLFDRLNFPTNNPINQNPQRFVFDLSDEGGDFVFVAKSAL